MKRNSDVFLGFGVIDPWQQKVALQEIQRIKDLGLHGVGEINPARQQFFPNDTRFYPLWEECQKLELPILFHSGMAGAGAGTPGGMGNKLKFTQPIHLDDVAADFPELKIICAHPSWPWTAESLAIARHKSNFYHRSVGLVAQVLRRRADPAGELDPAGQGHVGSDWPAIGVERWLEDFEKISIKPEVKQKLMLDNAKKFFGME